MIIHSSDTLLVLHRAIMQFRHFGYRKIVALMRHRGYPVPERVVRDAIRKARSHAN